MIELIVVLGLCVCSLALAAPLGRWVATLRVGAYEVQRLLAAVARAGADFLWQEGRLLGSSLVLLALAVLSPLLLYRGASAAPEHVGWTVLGLALGAGAAALVAYAAFAAAVGVTSRVVEAVRTDRSEASSATLREPSGKGSTCVFAKLSHWASRASPRCHCQRPSPMNAATSTSVRSVRGTEIRIHCRQRWKH